MHDDKTVRGRPRIYAAIRRNVTIRMLPDLRKALTEAAKINGRSVSNEIEHRLEQSFDREQIIDALAARLRDPKEDAHAR